MPWSSTDKHADITLSGSDKIATRAATAANHRGVRSVRRHNAGKWYAEIVLTNTNSDEAASIHFGISTGNGSLSAIPGISGVYGWSFTPNVGGASLNAYAYWDHGATAFASSASKAVQTEVIMVAVDFDAGKIWFGTKGVWRYDSHSPDPATGVDPVLTFPANSFFAGLMATLRSSGESVTLQATSADLTYSAPSGFTAWDDYPSVSGTVLGDTGTAAARTVRAYRHSDGLFMGETTSDGGTGAYTLDISGTDAVDVFCVDDAAGVAYNTLVLAGVTPA